MSAINTGMRLRRFNVKQDSKIHLIIDTIKGSQYTLLVVNVSLRGIAASLKIERISNPLDELVAGDIVPESKLVWDDNECALGRLSIVRARFEQDKDSVVAFSCIDAQLPLSGVLSRKLVEEDVSQGAPYEYELSTNRFSLADFTEAEFHHPDLFERCRQFRIFHNDLRANPLFQYYSVRSKEEGTRAKFYLSGKKRTVDAVSFAGYDYLGYSSHPEVKEAITKTLADYGVSAAGSLILSGKTDLHDQLESTLAQLFRKESCLIYSTGFGCNAGTVAGLMRPNDLIVADIFAHASLQDGISTSRSRARYFKHNDLDSLDQILTKYRGEANGSLLITEGLFSMEGTTPNLKEFVQIAKKHNSRTYIDEAHSIGVYGPNYLGVAERDDVLDDIDIFMGTCSKAFGIGAGGFICSSREVVDWLKYFSRPGMFSCALPPILVAALLKVLELMRTSNAPNLKLKENVSFFHDGLRKLGIKTPAERESPIIPIIINDEKTLGQMNQLLLEHGVYVNCIVFPAVPLGEARFRFSLTAKHTKSDIQLCLSALKMALEKFPKK